MKEIIRSLVLVWAVAAIGPASAFSLYDDLIFDLGLLNPSSEDTAPAASDIVR